MLDPTGLFDDPKFNKMAFQNKEEFVNAKPFPHIVFENFLDSDLVTELRDNFPDYDDDIAWHIRDTENIKKRYQSDDAKLPKILRLILRMSIILMRTDHQLVRMMFLKQMPIKVYLVIMHTSFR